MQKEYIQLGNKDVFNGQYMLTAFRIEGYDGKSILDVASEVVAESSNGSNVHVGSGTSFSATMGGIVYEADESKNLIYVAYPWRMFDSGGNVQNIMTFIAGNIFGMSSLKQLKLLDVYFPPQMLQQYDGPSTTIDDMRDYLQVYDSPILGTIIKPKIGLTASEYAELCYDFWVGGGHFVKNDEPQADQDFCPYFKMVDGIRSAMDRAEDETGRTKVHSFNVSAADFDTMIRRADYVYSKMRPGSFAFLIDGITAGWMAVQTLRRRYPDVFIHFHRAGHGAYTRRENPFGFTVPVLTKFARLAGASAIHTGTLGVGKMQGDVNEDGTAMQQGLRIQAQGSYFKQVWSKVSEEDSDLETMIRAEAKMWEAGPREVSDLRSKVNHMDPHTKHAHADWRLIKKTAPIASGGLNPVLLPRLIDEAGTIDFITTMGGGTHSHPMKTAAGAKAIVEAFHAWKHGHTLLDEAHDHVGHDTELQSAIRFFEKHGVHLTEEDHRNIGDAPDDAQPVTQSPTTHSQPIHNHPDGAIPSQG